jgi:hypothetical protein
MKDAYDFTDEQLWGPSKFRNAGDLRYPKPDHTKVNLQPWEGPLPDEVVDVVDVKGDSYLGDRSGPFWYSGNVRRSDTRGTVLQFDDLGPVFPYEPLKLGDARYFVREGDPAFWLSPREALQKYMELMNTLYADTWIRKGIEIHRQIASRMFLYTKEEGVIRNPSHAPHLDYKDDRTEITCYSDFRHIHECRLAKTSEDETLIPVLVRIKRPTVTRPPFNHRSETEQTRIRDAAFDFIIDNDGTLEDLYAEVDNIVSACSHPAWAGMPWSPNFVLPEIQETYRP